MCRVDTITSSKSLAGIQQVLHRGDRVRIAQRAVHHLEPGFAQAFHRVVHVRLGLGRARVHVGGPRHAVGRGGHQQGEPGRAALRPLGRAPRATRPSPPCGWLRQVRVRCPPWSSSVRAPRVEDTAGSAPLLQRSASTAGSPRTSRRACGTRSRRRAWRASSSSESSMSGTNRASQLGVSFCTSPMSGFTSAAIGTGSAFSSSRASSPITTTMRGRHHGELVEHARAALRRRLVGVVHRALHEHGAVDGERIDAQPLEALHQRSARAAVEGHALLDLRRPGRELEHHHVGLRVTRAQHRHEVAARAVLAALDLARELVQLADGALEVLLADLVVGGRHSDRGF